MYFCCDVTSVMAASRNLGRVPEALAALDAALAARPDFAEAHNNKGLTLLLADRKEDALASFMAAVASNAQFTQGYFGATQVLNQLGRHGEASELLYKAIEVLCDQMCGLLQCVARCACRAAFR
jgi:protein O-GlcNAc transferase